MNTLETTKRLILKVSEDDEIAFSKLYDIYFSKVFSFAGCFIRSVESRKEVVSDVFLTLWNNRARLPGIASFESYLFIITRNKSIDYLDRYKQTPAYMLDTSFEIIEEKDTPEFKMLYNELEALISKSINELPDRCKLIFLLSRDEGFTYQQIANILELSESTVNGQMVIAIRKLGDALRKYLRVILIFH